MEATNTYLSLFSSSSQTVRKPDPKSAIIIETELITLNYCAKSAGLYK